VILSGFVRPTSSSRPIELAGEADLRTGPARTRRAQIPRGFDVLTGDTTTFRTRSRNCPGRPCQVTLELWRHEDRADYLIVTEPIPAGTSVIEKSIRGSSSATRSGQA